MGSQNPTFPKKVLEKLGTVKYWESLNPDLTISDTPFQRPITKLATEAINTDGAVQQMSQEGYFQLDSVLPKADCERMANAIIRLADEGFPPFFAFIYDEFWQIFRNLSPLISPIFGDECHILENQMAWYIEPSEEGAGFTPHRDIWGVTSKNIPDNNPIRQDGLPWFATVWVALTDVSTLNSCINVLPANKDINLKDSHTNLANMFKNIQHFRALPCKAGSILSWAPYTMHWGAASSKLATSPRISIATYLARADMQQADTISMDPSQSLTFDFRLGNISRTMEQYGRSGIAGNDPTKENVYPAQLREFCTQYDNCKLHEKALLKTSRPV